MIHFREHFGLCSQAKEGDVISTTSSISTYRLLCAESPLFCQECAGFDDKRTDSERYAELRKIWQDMYAKYRIGEHLRPCPGCCACWGCEQDLTRVNPVSGNTLHWAGPKRKHTFECSMGPPLAGKKSKHIARMLKWQETLPDDCDGSGVLPARKQK